MLPTPTIKLGSTGEPVKRWQAIVKVPASGTFDAATDAATRQWQSAHGLTVDGIVGPQTWAAALGSGGSKGGGGDMMGAKPLPHAGPPNSTNGREWALTELPANATPERDASILAAVKSSGWIMPAWVPVTYEKDGHTIVIFAWTDCLAIGLSDPVRVNVYHSTAQRIADALGGCMLPTSRMSDAAYQAAAKLRPQILGASAKMSTTEWMVKHSDKVSAEKAKSGAGFVRDAGKDWVNTERLLVNGKPAVPTHSTIGAGGGKVPAGANFGWHAPDASLKSPGGAKVWQSVGLAHDMNYTDYSQVCTLYRAECTVDGASRSVEEVLRDPDKAYLLSDEVSKGTACKVWRHPAVPVGG